MISVRCIRCNGYFSFPSKKHYKRAMFIKQFKDIEAIIEFLRTRKLSTPHMCFFDLRSDLTDEEYSVFMKKRNANIRNDLERRTIR